MSHLMIQTGISIPKSEFKIQTCRASGSGGQHVNKTNSKVRLTWNILSTEIFSPEQRLQVLDRLKNRITSAGDLVIYSDAYRSQFRNIEDVENKLQDLIKRALFVHKERKATRLPRSKKEKRLKLKKQHSNKKAQRRKSNWD